MVRGFLGVALQPVRLPKSSSASDGPNLGLLVIMIDPDGPAEKGGVMIGDIIVALGDRPLTGAVDLQATLDPEQVGKTVQLRILRGGQNRNVSLTVGERPE